MRVVARARRRQIGTYVWKGKIEYFSESGKSEHIVSPEKKRVARRFLRGGRKSAVTSVRRKFREVNAHLLVHREAHQVQLAPLACPASMLPVISLSRTCTRAGFTPDESDRDDEIQIMFSGGQELPATSAEKSARQGANPLQPPCIYYITHEYT